MIAGYHVTNVDRDSQDKVNVDEEPELASRYGVMSIPTIVAMNDGKISKQMVGVQSKTDILKMFE